MKQDAVFENLFDVLTGLQNSLNWLNRSFRLCANISKIDDCTEDQIDDIEAFMARFARTSDILIQKVFRAIDSVEFEDTGTLIDTVNRAEKRGIVDTITTMRSIRETRNLISHEYASENLQALLSLVSVQTPDLLKICEKAISYCERFKR